MIYFRLTSLIVSWPSFVTLSAEMPLSVFLVPVGFGLGLSVYFVFFSYSYFWLIWCLDNGLLHATCLYNLHTFLALDAWSI